MSAILVAASACNDGGLFSPNTTGRGVHLQLRPYFASLDAMSSMSADINVVRVTIKQLPSGTEVLRQEFSVDPTAGEWNLPVEVPPNSNLDVLIELINKTGPTETVVYSGNIQVSVTTGPQPPPAPVPVYPGGPDNLTVTSVTISPRDQSVLEGDAVQLSAKAEGKGAPSITWLSLNSNVATVDATGKVTTKLPGTAVISAMAGPKQDNIVITVGPRATKVDLTPTAATLVSLGADATFTGKILDARGAEVPGLSLAWSIADPTIASPVTPGVFRARKNGTTTVTATTTQAGTSTSASVTLTVGQKAVSVAINPASASFTALGATSTFTASAKDANGNDVTGVPFTWSSADAGVATVDANGVVTSRGNGSTKIKVEAAGASAEATVTVQQQPKTMTVTPAFLTLTYIGGQGTLSAEVKDANGNLMKTPVFWVSGAPGTVAIDPNTGTVTAVADGATIVTAIAGSLRASAGVTVKRTATNIRLNKTSFTLSLGQTQQLTGELVDAGGTPAPGNAITWSSSNPTIATVSSTGLVTGVKPGEVSIKADAVTAEATAQVVVTTLPPTTGPPSLALIPQHVLGVGNCIPFGQTTSYGFQGFIYRNVPPFTLRVGDKIAFDLGALNDVEIHRDVYFATANKNPAAASSAFNTTSQSVAAVSWTKVVDETQTPSNPRGNQVIGDYELVWTAEAPFTFAGGGFIVGFSARTMQDNGCEQVLVQTDASDPSGYFYARFYSKATGTLGVLDNESGGNATALGGIKIYAAGSPSGRPFTGVPSLNSSLGMDFVPTILLPNPAIAGSVSNPAPGSKPQIRDGATITKALPKKKADQ